VNSTKARAEEFNIINQTKKRPQRLKNQRDCRRCYSCRMQSKKARKDCYWYKNCKEQDKESSCQTRKARWGCKRQGQEKE